MAQQDSANRLTWLVLALLWGGLLVVLYLTGALERCYQTAPYFYFTGAAGVVLILLSAKAALAILRGHSVHCHCEGPSHDHDTPGLVGWPWWRQARSYLAMGLVLMPLVIGVLVPSRGLNALAALRRGGASDPQQILSAFRAERREFIEMEGQYSRLNVLEVLDAAYRAETVKVSTIGFVFHDKNAPGDMFRVVRFKMTCCAADALPIMVHVRWPKGRQLQNDTWIKILGTARREKIKGRDVVVITADKVMEIPSPSRLYI